jgi:hypothetical protein
MKLKNASIFLLFFFSFLVPEIAEFPKEMIGSGCSFYKQQHLFCKIMRLHLPEVVQPKNLLKIFQFQVFFFETYQLDFNLSHLKMF